MAKRSQALVERPGGMQTQIQLDGCHNRNRRILLTLGPLDPAHITQGSAECLCHVLAAGFVRRAY